MDEEMITNRQTQCPYCELVASPGSLFWAVKDKISFAAKCSGAWESPRFGACLVEQDDIGDGLDIATATEM